MAKVFGGVKNWVKRHKILTALLILLLVAFIALRFVLGRAIPAAADAEYQFVRTTTLQKTTLSDSVSVSGTVGTGEEASVTVADSAKAYKVAAVNVQVGDTVKKGDVIATLDTTELLSQIESAEESYQESLDSAQTSYDRTLDDYNTNAVKHENNLIDLQENIDEAEKALSEAEEALSSAQSTKNSADSSYSAAQSDYNTAVAQLNSLQSGYDTAVSQVSDAQKQYDDAAAALSKAQSDLTTAQSALDSASAALDAAKQLDASANQSVISSAENTYTAALGNYNTAVSTLNSRQSNFDAAETALQSAQSAAGYAAISAQYQAAQAAVTQKQAAMESAKAAASAAENALTAAEKTVESAEKSLNSAYDSYDNEKNYSSMKTQARSLEDAATKLEQAAETPDNLETLRETLENCTLTATMDGTITALNATVGSACAGAVATIQNTEALIVEVTIPANSVSDVAVGMACNITSDATGDDVIQGTLTRIDPVANTQGSFGATVRVNGEATGLLIGIQAKVEIVMNEKSDVFTVPIDAVGTAEDGSNYVLRKTGGEGTDMTFEEVTVTTGDANDYYIEISGDLAEGDVIRSSADLTEGIETADTEDLAGMMMFGGGGMGQMNAVEGGRGDMGGGPSGDFGGGGGNMPSGGGPGGM